jgi:hypothetical protein
MTYQQFIEAHPDDYQELLAKPESGYVIATASAEEMTELQGASGDEYNQLMSNLIGGKGQTGSEVAAGIGVEDKTTYAGLSPGSSGTYDLGENTIQAIGKAFQEAQNG